MEPAQFHHVSCFIPGYASIMAPLRQLIRDDVPWEWTSKCDEALHTLKSSLSTDPVCAFYNPDKPIWISMDASPVGLGAIVTQGSSYKAKVRPVVGYTSCALTDAETRYSQTEREALGIVCTCEYFHLYIYSMVPRSWW